MFEIAAELPPPQIRGSRIARQTLEVPVGESLNVFRNTKKNVLVIAKEGVFRYELGQSSAQRYAPISASAPLVAWADPRRADSFFVRQSGDRSLREYSVGARQRVPADSPSPPAQPARRVETLKDFDHRLFTLLADGTPLYSTPGGLVRSGSASKAVAVSALPNPATLLFADSRPARYWSADGAGSLTLWDSQQGTMPVANATIPGVAIDADVEGERVAVLSIKLDGRRYLPSVTIFSQGKELGRMDIGPSFSRQQPALDVCLIAGRPWAVLASKRWLQLLDWESRRLLAEW